VSLIEVDGELVALPVVEARPRERGFYDFEARYTPGATVFDAPADLPAESAAEAQRLASRVRAARLRGPARIDPDGAEQEERLVAAGHATRTTRCRADPKGEVS